MKGGLLSAWVVAVGLITWRGVKQVPRTTPLPMPLPSTYVSTFVVYGGLSLLPDSAAGFAGATGWAFVLAIALNLFTPTGAVKSTSTVPAGAAPVASATPSSKKAA
jgi:uncharacterized membrane protein